MTTEPRATSQIGRTSRCTCFADGHPQITEELQLPVFERGLNGSLHARPPSRPLDPPLSARARFYRRYSAEWWQVNE
jgi:hypothetical protein